MSVLDMPEEARKWPIGREIESPWENFFLLALFLIHNMQIFLCVARSLTIMLGVISADHEPLNSRNIPIRFAANDRVRLVPDPIYHV